MRKIILRTMLLCSATIVNAEEPILGGPCQGCEFVFQDMPKEILPTAILVPSNTVGSLMINMVFMPLYMWEMWDVTPVTDTRTDNGKVGQYSVWAESAICFLDAPVYWGRWNEMSKDFPLFLLQNLLRCSQSFQLVVSNLGNTTATSFHFDWSKHFQQINPFKQIQLFRALLQNNLHHKRFFYKKIFFPVKQVGVYRA